MRPISRLTALSHVATASLIQNALNFIGILALTRLLLPEEFASIRVAMAYVAIAVVLATGGLTTPVLRYCADPVHAANQKAFLETALHRLIRISGLVTLLCFALVLIFRTGTKEQRALLAYAVQIPFLAITTLLMTHYQAVQRFQFFALSQILTRSIPLLTALVAAWAFGFGGFLLVMLLSVALIGVYLVRESRLDISRNETCLPSDFHAIARYSLLGTALSMFSQYADLLMLDWSAISKSELALYSLATLFFFAASTVVGAAQSVSTPAFTGLMHDRTAFTKTLRKWTLLLLLGSLVVTAGTILIALLIETHFLGPSYSGLTRVVAILMLKFVLWSSYAIAGTALVGIGAIKAGTWLAATTTLLALLIGWPMIQTHGIWGGAWTQVLATLLTAMLVWGITLAEIRKLRTPLRQSPTESSDHV